MGGFLRSQRVAKQDNANVVKIAAQFTTVARQHERPESERNAQFDLIRGAVVYA